MGLISLYTKWANIDFLDIAADTLLSMDDYTSGLNRIQLSKGLRDDGSALDPEYADSTKHIKSNKSGLAGVIEHVTLYDEGDFHKSIFSSIISNSLVMDSEDDKLGILIGKYGDMLGLTKDSISKLRAKFMPIYISNIIKKLR